MYTECNSLVYFLLVVNCETGCNNSTLQSWTESPCRLQKDIGGGGGVFGDYYKHGAKDVILEIGFGMLVCLRERCRTAALVNIIG